MWYSRIDIYEKGEREKEKKEEGMIREVTK
jgi:hypothetical protein